MNKWDKAHMEVAQTYAQLSSAKRSKVGCVIVKENRIISIGYNGMPSGWDNECEYWLPKEGVTFDVHPKDIEIYCDSFTKPEVLHAETNAIAKVARSSESCEGATLYTTMMPCLDCAKLIYQSGISRVVYENDYPKGDAGVQFLTKCNLSCEKFSEQVDNHLKVVL